MGLICQLCLTLLHVTCGPGQPAGESQHHGLQAGSLTVPLGLHSFCPVGPKGLLDWDGWSLA